MKLGIYGGTFSPPHLGHVRAAGEFVRAEGLDRLLIMPAFIPPNKSDRTEDDSLARLEMCRLAFEDVPGCEVSPYETEKGGISFTADTLRHFSGEGTELFFLCGSDRFLTLSRWRGAEEIFGLAHITVMMRGGDGDVYGAAKGYAERYGAKTTVLSTPPLEVSSSAVREMLENGGDARRHLSRKVAEYIEENGLYRRR